MYTHLSYLFFFCFQNKKVIFSDIVMRGIEDINIEILDFSDSIAS